MGYYGNISQTDPWAEKDEAGGQGRASKYFKSCKMKRNSLSCFYSQCSLES